MHVFSVGIIFPESFDRIYTQRYFLKYKLSLQLRFAEKGHLNQCTQMHLFTMVTRGGLPARAESNTLMVT